MPDRLYLVRNRPSTERDKPARGGRTPAAAAARVAVALAAFAWPLAALTPQPARAFTLCPKPISQSIWALGPAGWTLKVYPTTCGRLTAAVSPTSVFAKAVALANPPPGKPARWDPNPGSMLEQFECHAWGTPLVDPTKPSWNLDTWRPQVPWATEIRYACNPPAGASR